MNLAKMLANFKLEGKTEFQGLPISIENDKGSTRKGTGKDGKPWSVTMTYAYGYIRMSEGVDGDHVDCFLGPNKDAKNAYVIHTNEPTTGDYDEDKCMLGFESAAEAKKAFLENYSSPKFFGSMDEIPMDKFKEKVLATRQTPKKLEAKSRVQATAELYSTAPKPILTVGDQVVVDGLQGRGMVLAIKGDRITIQYRNKLTIERPAYAVHAVSGRLVT